MIMNKHRKLFNVEKKLYTLYVLDGMNLRNSFDAMLSQPINANVTCDGSLECSTVS